MISMLKSFFSSLRRYMRPVGAFLMLYAALLLPMVAARIVFVLLHGKGEFGFVDVANVVWHGLPLDLSVGGYAMLGCGLLLIARLWFDGSWLRVVFRCFLALVAAVLCCCLVLNIVLYGYWQFPLDSMPLFYFFSSPADAMASVSGGYVAGVLLLTLVLTLLTWWLLCSVLRPQEKTTEVRSRVGQSVVLLLLVGALFLPIRGGVTVSTMNTGRAYFSETMLLNHAAVNPVLSLVESLVRERDFASQYHFMEDAEAGVLFDEVMRGNGVGEDAYEAPLLAKGSRPNVLLLILEGFSAHLMQTLGGESDMAVELDSIARQGLLFTNMYASSFRTDRGLVAILSGFPSQPTTSIMKYPHKTAHLPGIAKSLRGAGYSTAYYYGGDADFTNMRSYLRNTGFDRIVSDTDFPLSERLSKWGVHDHVLLERVGQDFVREASAGGQLLCVAQTSSSHEPYEVPYNGKADKRRNAFCYTDSVVGTLVRELKRSAVWDNTLVVIVPDHMGGYPDNIPPTSPQRYHIPLIMTGGALARKGCIDTLGDQTDLAATLLAALGLGTDDFVFSKDLLCGTTPHRAYFSFPDLFGWIDADGTCVFDNAAGKVVYEQKATGASNSQTLLRRGKAYLQTIYKWINDN